MAKKTKEEKKVSFLDRLSNAGGALIDGLADETVVGKPIQALLNTQGYQDRVLKREANKQALLADRMRIQEYMDNAPSRKKERDIHDMQANEYIAGASNRKKEREVRDMRANEYIAGASNRKAKDDADMVLVARNKMVAEEYMAPEAVQARKQQQQADNSRGRLAEEIADQTYMNARTTELIKGLEKDLANNPEYSMLSFSEQKAFAESPRTQALIESKYYLEEIMKIAGKDRQAFERMDRILRREGWSIVDGEDGVKYLDMGEKGKLPATKEGIQALQKVISKSALEELSIRANLSDASSLGNPVLRSASRHTRALMPFNNNDATASFHVVKGIFDNASEEEKSWHLFNQAIKDYYDSGVPPQAKMGGFEKCIPFLQKMGYALDIDPKNPDPATAKIYDIKNQRNISFGEFAKICEQNDTLSQVLSSRLSDAGVKFEQEQKQALLKSMQETNKSISDKSDDEPESEAFKSYRHENIGEYTRLDRKKSDKLSDAYDTFAKENQSFIANLARTPTVDDLDNLKAIDLSWKKILQDSGLDPSKFPSPVQNEMFKVELQELYKEKEALQASLDEVTTPYTLGGSPWSLSGSMMRSGNRQANSMSKNKKDTKKQKEFDKIKKHLSVIEAGIAKRESALKKNDAAMEN